MNFRAEIIDRALAGPAGVRYGAGAEAAAAPGLPAMKVKAVETVLQCIIKTASSADAMTDCVKPPKTTWRTRL